MEFLFIMYCNLFVTDPNDLAMIIKNIFINSVDIYDEMDISNKMGLDELSKK